MISDRAEGLIRVFSNSIDVVNREITQQIKTSPAKIAQTTETVKENQNIDQLEQIAVSRWPVDENTQVITQNQKQFQDYFVERINPVIPDQFIISFNEYEQAFILERKVKMPILGNKIELLEQDALGRVQQKQSLQKNKVKAYVYYSQDNPNEEEKQEIIKNLHKPKNLPLIQRKKGPSHASPKSLPKKSKIKQSVDLNSTFCHPEAEKQPQTLAPNFLKEHNSFHLESKSSNIQIQQSDSNYNPVYNTTKKTWEDFSQNIENQRREIKNDLPKEVIKSRFKNKEFQKLVARKDYPSYLGRINKPPPQNSSQGEQIFQDGSASPLRNQKIAKSLENANNIRINDFSDVQMDAYASGTDKTPYSLHNVKLTFEQWESLEQNRHLWESVLSYDEIKILRQVDSKFYHIMQLLKLKFNQDHKSEYVKQLRLDLTYASRRDELGGIITKADKERFHQRIEKLLQRDLKRKERRRKRKKSRSRSITNAKGNFYVSKPKNWEIKTSFKNSSSRMVFQEVFINPFK